VHVAITEAAARGDVEVANNLVNAQPALDSAALVALLIQLLAVVLALALLDVFAPTESPGGLRVRVLDFLAGVAASGLLRIGRGLCAVARTAVVWVEMDSDLVTGVPFPKC
jgi:hypothetical protein